MAVPNLTKEDILKALPEVTEKTVPNENERKYNLATDDGEKYPAKAVVTRAAKIANIDMSKHKFNSIEAKNYLIKLKFNVQTTLTISAENPKDKSFYNTELKNGSKYKLIDVYFKPSDSDKEIRWTPGKGEQKINSQTLPRLAFQIFESQITAMSIDERKKFPSYRTISGKPKYGIYLNEEYKSKYKDTSGLITYSCHNGQQFTMYYENIFSNIIFVQECLKRFGKEGDQFVLIYQKKDGAETEQNENESAARKESSQQSRGYKNRFSDMLIKSKNLIFRGAPGTGKTYLARQIAADIISHGEFDDYARLMEDDERKKQVEFVQFHPSYDYSDFVEGLRPRLNKDGTMGFERQDGIFKRFVARAKDDTVEAMMNDFLHGAVGVEFKILSANTFNIKEWDNNYIKIHIPNNEKITDITLKMDELKKTLLSDKEFTRPKDITDFFERPTTFQGDSYIFKIYDEILKKNGVTSKAQLTQKRQKKYIFIIDEINRGEISKIFGELFFSIDPGYRGKAGAVSTQYSKDSDEKFYIPDNVYIIGTMNDIDRSVDSFDFAMRRRFRFVELEAGDRLEMLDSLEDEELKKEAVRRMTNLNEKITHIEDLNKNYHIGPAYFLKLKSLPRDECWNKLWEDYLKPLLQDYIQGMANEKTLMAEFAAAYGYTNSNGGDADENSEN